MEANDMKAMREALEAFVAYWDWNGYDAMRESRLKDMARAALAKPPRNCDRFQVAAEALQEWQSLVKAKPNTWDFRYNYWLFAPAVEREGEDDGSK